MKAGDITWQQLWGATVPMTDPTAPRSQVAAELAVGREAMGSATESPIASRSLRTWPRVTVIIPTLNEAANLPHVLPRLPIEIHEVIVVDGHSEDDTIEVARAFYPEVRVVLQDKHGKGNAIACGLREATGDAVVLLDADGSADPAEIPHFVEALEAGAEYVKGSRYLEGGGSNDLSRFRSVGNRILSALVNVLFRSSYTDLCYGYNAFWRRLASAVYRSCDGFEVETVLNVRASRADLAIVEIPSFEHQRISGASNLHAISDGVRVLRAILRERLARGPTVPAPVPRRVIRMRDGAVRLEERRSRSRPNPAGVPVPNGGGRRDGPLWTR